MKERGLGPDTAPKGAWIHRHVVSLMRQPVGCDKPLFGREIRRYTLCCQQSDATSICPAKMARASTTNGSGL